MNGIIRLYATLVGLIFLISSSGLFAQNMGRDYAVILSDSSVVRGRLMNFKPGESVSVKLGNGRILNFEGEQILRVMPYKEYKASHKVEKPYRFREKGWFGDLSMATYHGGSGGDPNLGGGFEGVFGMRFNRWLEVGAGVGYGNYQIEVPFRVVPVFARVRGYFLSRKLTPFYQLQAGYGWGLKAEEERLIEGGGGWLIHPSVGFRFGGGPAANGYLDIGYRFQGAAYTRQEFWDATTRLNYRFQRFTLRLGLLF